jgi:HK97 family phage portal protein
VSLKQRIDAFLHPERVKINPAYSGLIQYSDQPKAVTMPKNYKAYAKEGYRGNDTAFKCISYIARNGSAIPPVLYTDHTKQKKIEKHPLLDKLDKPNSEQSGVAYREAALAYKLLSGNSYQYAIRKGKIGAPDELWVLRPDLVSIMPSKTRGIVGYEYEYFETPIPPENIGHTKYWNPDNDLYGLSPIEVGAVLIDQQKAAKLWNLALLQNSARPPGAWTVPTALSKNDRERLEGRLKEKLQGYRNAGTPPVLDAGLKWESMGLPPAQLDYLTGMQYNAAMIANLFNIPPQIIGDNSATTYNNMQQAKAASYTEAIFPELDDLYAMWNVWLVPMYPDLSGAYLYYDKESVEVVQQMIQEQKDAQIQRATDLWNSGQCTLNEARVLSGLPEVEYGDLYKFGDVLVPAESMKIYALQSLAEPAAPPLPINEPLSIQQSQDNNNEQEEQAQAEKKALEILALAALDNDDKEAFNTAMQGLGLFKEYERPTIVDSVHDERTSRQKDYSDFKRRLENALTA